MDVVYCSAITADAGQIALSYRSSRPAAHAYRRHSTKQSTDLPEKHDQPLIEHDEGLLAHIGALDGLGAPQRAPWSPIATATRAGRRRSPPQTVGVLALTCCDDRCQRRRNHATTGRLNGQTRPGSPTNPGFTASLYASRARNLLQVLNGVWTRLAPPARPHLPPAISGRAGGASHAQPLIIFPHSLIKFPH